LGSIRSVKENTSGVPGSLRGVLVVTMLELTEKLWQAAMKGPEQQEGDEPRRSSEEDPRSTRVTGAALAGAVRWMVKKQCVHAII
jgi:hypothetical protein